MKITRSTREYEQWLGKQVKLVPGDLEQKHENMSSDAFIFLRATYYRWAQIWPGVCADLAKAPVVFAVGDLHIENFGTWRDAEGRLIWGVNDFDEVYWLPYTNDLCRLACSALLAGASNHLSISDKDACKALLTGYAEGLASGGRPFVLGENHPELRKMAIGILRDPVHFWKKLESQTGSIKRTSVPREALQALTAMMPEPDLDFKLFARQAGQGSLGRQRFVGIADYRGGRIAREAKALALSACAWAAEAKSSKILYSKMLDQAVRCADPFVKVKGRWIVRRLAPDCSRIDLSALPQERDERILLEAMGFELANIHLGTRESGKQILADLKKRPSGWLLEAAQQMAGSVHKDWKLWREKHQLT